METHFGESMDFSGALRAASTAAGTMLGAINREHERISTQNLALMCTVQEFQARERARDQTIETMFAMIRELQRRMDEASGKP